MFSRETTKKSKVVIHTQCVGWRLFQLLLKLGRKRLLRYRETLSTHSWAGLQVQLSAAQTFSRLMSICCRSKDKLKPTSEVKITTAVIPSRICQMCSSTVHNMQNETGTFSCKLKLPTQTNRQSECRILQKSTQASTQCCDESDCCFWSTLRLGWNLHKFTTGQN